MTFQEYVRMVKPYWKEKTSNEDACNLLMGGIIGPAKIPSSEGEGEYYFSNVKTSQLLNGYIDIPQKILAHVTDDVVTMSIVKYFEKEIVPRLQPATGELRQQMLCTLQKDAACTPAMGTIFAALSKADAPAPFFAAALLYVLTAPYQAKRNAPEPSAPSASGLMLSGITKENRLSQGFCVLPFREATPYPSAPIYKEIVQAYKDISACNHEKLAENRAFFDKAAPALDMMMKSGFTKKVQVTISEPVKDCIRTFAEEHDIKMPEDFFDVGKLCEYTSVLSIGLQAAHPDEEVEPFGTAMEQWKYKAIQALPEKIGEYRKRHALDELFDGIHILRLALTNDTSEADESIHVSVYLPQAACFQRDDLDRLSREHVGSVQNDHEYWEIFDIPKAEEYLDYSETRQGLHVNPIPYITPFRMSKKECFDRVWDDIFPYDGFRHGNDLCIQLKFDQLNPKTSAAFPSMILLKQPVDHIRYQIQSKHAPEKVQGELSVQKEKKD